MLDGPHVERARPYLKPLGLVALVVLVVPFVVFAVPQTVGADHSYIVLTSSMSPAIPAGSMIVVAETAPSEVQQDDVITFDSPGGIEETATGPERVTHRVVEVVQENGDPHFRTQGDANDEPDPNLVPPGNLIGRVMFSIPLVGYLVSFANTDAGILALVVVPAVLLGLNEVVMLLREARQE
jgi:signal peptidase